MVDELAPRFAQRATWKLSTVAQRSHQLLAAAFAERGRRGYDFRVLAALDHFGELHQAAIGRHTGLDPSDVTQTVRDLEAAGELTRLPSSEDRRRMVIAITPAGKRTLSRLESAIDTAEAALLAPLSDAQRERLLEGLEVLAQAHDRR
ncbi:MarR family winged helix-turn-helix transcriptional regulator [Agromyces albus]|uniref:MarR family transcriptional regulator n=1 Tax=Agromyces albus TaxID=205332 RepID=A0A4Q2L432_9MICO|nr:MarR family transcriptional regulator [Agromyces albus]RXZ72948.1 MarR family transcriptional regulator [Agromyces albus]